MKYYIIFFILVLCLSGCSEQRTNDSFVRSSSGVEENTGVFDDNDIDVSQFEKILSKKLVNFVPNFPVVSGERYSDPDGDGKIPGLLLSIQRTDIGVQFQYIKELTTYYHNNSGLSLQEYVNQLDLLNVSRDLLNPYQVQVITGDWQNIVKSGCNLIPRHILTDYDSKQSEYRPIQTLVHRESYPDNDPMSQEDKLCDDPNAELYIDRELWALNDTFAIRLPQCGIGCAPGPDFRWAATIRPI